MRDLEPFNIDNSPLMLQLVLVTGLSKHEVTRLVFTAPIRYKVYEIKKKHKVGTRIIAHPAAELKVLQRWLARNFLNDLPVHPAAMAYECNTSIKDNAERHANKKYLMKLDFANFFPSIKPIDLFNKIDESKIKITHSDKIGLANLLFWKPKEGNTLQLSIGAPSSPRISNVVMYNFDQYISEYCVEKNIVYTRYADDLTFSTNIPNLLQECQSFVRQIIEKHKSPNLIIKEEKTVFSSKKFNRRVTGLVLTNDGKVSLGHKKKRQISASIHHFMNNKLSPEDAQKLRGILAYANAVEKDFIRRMTNKYGHELMQKIKTYEIPEKQTNH